MRSDVRGAENDVCREGMEWEPWDEAWSVAGEESGRDEAAGETTEWVDTTIFTVRLTRFAVLAGGSSLSAPVSD